MAAPKTRETDASVEDFLAGLADRRRADEAAEVVAMMARITGAPPRLWGDSMIGFGRYHYRNTTGDDLGWFLTGVAPRTGALTVYIMPGFDDEAEALARLGPHRTGRSCLYIRRLDKVDAGVLEGLVSRSVAMMRSRYPHEP